MLRSRLRQKVVTLALQGGGSHGAFTWGVLDGLLEDHRIDFEAISGASAGAVNAVVLAHGFSVRGREGAREALASFWQAVSEKAALASVPVAWPDTVGPSQALAPGLTALIYLSRFLAPYQFNPFKLNPLRDLLSEHVDFERLRARNPIRLFIAATQISTGRLKLFSNEEIVLEALLASACIPTLHHPVEIDGEAYWDGALTANPPLRPLIYKCRAADLMLVLLDPCRRPDVPETVDQITQRLTEISFSSALAVELQGIALAKEEAERSILPFGRLDQRLRALKFHVIAREDEEAAELNALTKLDARAELVNLLYEEGRCRAEAWLQRNFDQIGVRSSFELTEHVY